jgi:peptide/nickel transport system permease protein
MPDGRANVANQVRPRSRVTGWRAAYMPDRRKPWHRLLLHSRAGIVGLSFLLLMVAISILAPVISPHDPTFINPIDRLQPPSTGYWFGTDDLGRDIFSRVIHGGRISLLVGLTVTSVSALFGGVLGLLAGYHRRFDGLIMRLMDGLMAFPGILLAIAVVVSLGARFSSVVLALTLVYIPVVARLVRSMTLVIRELPYVESARCMGVPDRTILWRYVLANAVSPLIVQATFITAYAILAEASLSFLGASINPEIPTWGNMLRDGQRLITTAWWMAVPPGAVLFLTVLACTLLGDSLRDALDPRTRERQEDGFLT